MEELCSLFTIIAIQLTLSLNSMSTFVILTRDKLNRVTRKANTKDALKLLKFEVFPGEVL